MNHGTASAYVYYKCRCQECRDGMAARSREKSRLKAYGRYENAFVDAAPVRVHVQQLAKQGWGVDTIIDKSGVSRTAVRTLLYGRTPSERADGHYLKPQQVTRIKRENAEKLFALRFNLDESPDGAVISARGTQRRIQALAVAGFTLRWQADQIGWNISNYAMILERDSVRVSTYRLVRDLFEKYEMLKPVPAHRWEAGGITRTKKLAKAKGWLPAAAWDNIDLDEAPPVVENSVVVDSVIVDGLMAGVKHDLPYGSTLPYVAEMIRRGAGYSQVRCVININGDRFREAKILAKEGKEK